MRIVIQRVRSCSVTIEGTDMRKISRGLLILLGIEHSDTEEDADWLVKKIVQLRIFPDESGKMNRSIEDIDGSIMLISQFTLHASTKKGNRPSFIRAAKADRAVSLYNYMIGRMNDYLSEDITTGEFGAHMLLDIQNDGPVTIIIDTKAKE